MLSVPAPFPYSGAIAFLRPCAEFPEPVPCRIIQRRGDGRATIALTDRRFGATSPDLKARASGNRTVDLAELAATAEEALPPAPSKAVAAPRSKPKTRSSRAASSVPSKVEGAKSRATAEGRRART